MPRIVLANGCFDPLHYGHILHLREAKKLGDILIVAVTRNKRVNKGPDRPRFDEEERADMLRELRCVDRVILVDGLLEAFYLVWPNVFVKDQEYEGKIGRQHEYFCKTHNVEIVFTKTKKYSSSEMLAKGYFAAGHCEVHPWVHESYPCSVCLAESTQRMAAVLEEALHYSEMEHAYYAQLVGAEEYDSWAK